MVSREDQMKAAAEAVAGVLEVERDPVPLLTLSIAADHAAGCCELFPSLGGYLRFLPQSYRVAWVDGLLAVFPRARTDIVVQRPVSPRDPALCGLAVAV